MLVASSTACTNTPAASPSGATETPTLSNLAPPESGILSASVSLRNALGLLANGSENEALETLSNIKKGSASSQEDRELASYILALRLSRNSQKDPQILGQAADLYSAAFSNKVLGNFARLKAAELLEKVNDEEKLQSFLDPAARRVAALKINQKSTETKASAIDQQIDARILYALAQSYFRSQNHEKVRSTLSLIRKSFPSSAYAVGSSYYLGRIAMEQDKDYNAALAQFREYLTKSPGGRFAPEIVRTLQELADGDTDSDTTAADNPSESQPKISLTQNDHNLMAYACYRHTLWKMALDEWAKSGNRHILRPICMARTGAKQEAVNEYLSIVKADPKNSLVINAATELANPLTKAEALTLWKALALLPVKGQDEILWNIGKRDKNAEYSSYKKIVDSYPTSNHVDDALWWLIWHHIEASYHTKGKAHSAHLTQAAKLCVIGVQKFPNSELAPLYAFWSGKIHEKTGHRSEAINIYKTTSERYPLSYYGYRSKHRVEHLNSLIRKSKDPSAKIVADRMWHIHPQRHSPVTNWQWPAPPKLFSWSQMSKQAGTLPTALAWLGDYDSALSLLPSSAPKYFRGWLMVQNGQVLRGLGLVAWKLKGKPERTPFWFFAYPLAYSGDIDREARKHGVDPLLAHGLIRQESRYDPNARSRSNAMGLMQLLKGTAYGVAKHNGITLASTEQIFEPETNIKLGCAYLGYVLRGKEGNAMLAVASYNGGPNAVKRWMIKHKASGVQDMDYFVENIPFRETRGYVRKVFANYWNYETLYLNKKKN